MIPGVEAGTRSEAMETRQHEGQQQHGGRGERPGRRAGVAALVWLAGLALIGVGLAALARGAVLLACG